MSVAVVVTSILAAHAASIWVLGVGILAGLYFLNVMAEGTVSYVPAEDDEPVADPVKRRTNTSPALAYAGAGLLAIVSSFAKWHETSERTWNGFQRGGGIPAIVAGIVLLLMVLVILKPPARWQRASSSAGPDAFAGVCGAALVIASISGTGGGDMYTGRWLALLAGLIAFAVSSTTLVQWSSDIIFQRGVLAGITGLMSATVVAGSLMSWGSWRFLVNYVPGTSTGGFDGRFSMVAGLAVGFASVNQVLSGRFENKEWNRWYASAAVTLGTIALFAVFSGGAPVESHPGRTLTGFAAFAMICAGVAAFSQEGQNVRPPTASASTNWAKTTDAR